MICPQCKREYREGFTECAYCKVPLVEALPEEENTPEEAPEELSGDIIEELLPDEETLQEAGVSKEEFLTALRAEMEKERSPKPKRFRTARERLNDTKTSGWTLGGVGIIGVLCIVLCVTGVIPIHLSGVSFALTYGTMGIMFLLFLIVGIRSLAKLSSLEEEVKQEEEKTREIREYMLGEFTAEKTDEAVKERNEEAGGDYYARIAYLKEKMLARYEGLDEAYADYLLEDIYQTLFEE